MGIQFSQHYFLKRLSVPPLNYFPCVENQLANLEIFIMNSQFSVSWVISSRTQRSGHCLQAALPGPRQLVRPSSGGPSWTQERTLVAVKPEGVQRRLISAVIQRFERRGFKLVGMKMLQAPESILAEHYQDLQRKPFYPALISYMSSGLWWQWSGKGTMWSMP